jgi:hypothetical protein
VASKEGRIRIFLKVTGFCVSSLEDIDVSMDRAMPGRFLKAGGGSLNNGTVTNP